MARLRAPGWEKSKELRSFEFWAHVVAGARDSAAPTRASQKPTLASPQHEWRSTGLTMRDSSPSDLFALGQTSIVLPQNRELAGFRFDRGVPHMWCADRLQQVDPVVLLQD